VRIDRSDSADGPEDTRVARNARSTPDAPDVAGKDAGTAVSGDGTSHSPYASSDTTLLTERFAVHCAKVDAVYRQYAIDHGHARAEKLERETAAPGPRRIEAEGSEADPEDPDDRPKVEGRLAEAFGLEKVETLPPPGGDVQDDPRNYSNPKTGRLDASWSVYDRAIDAAREHSGGDLGRHSIKMYDYNPETGEGTGTLIGEQTPDRLRGWRIDGQDGHVNWWDWTGGKKGSGGVYGHDWFPEDPSAPGSRYIGWAPWQDSDGNILEGN
jgi:hypothetical protein